MRMSLLGTHVTMLSCAAALMTANAWAQDAAAPPPPTPATEPAPVAPAPAPAPVAAPEAPPAQVQPDTAAQGSAPDAPAAEPAAEAPAGPSGWFRIDSDLGGIQLWAGATHPLGEGIGLASDIYLTGSLGEFDLGPAFTAGDFTITPMLGYQIDWAARKSNSLVPQLYVTGGPDPIYMEFWFQNYENQIFTDGAPNDIYTRLFVNYKLSPFISIGPEIEPWFALNEAGGRKTGISSFVVGGNVMFFSYGTNNTLQLFLGYETKKSAQTVGSGDEAVDGRKLGGRFSFVHNW